MNYCKENIKLRNKTNTLISKQDMYKMLIYAKSNGLYIDYDVNGVRLKGYQSNNGLFIKELIQLFIILKFELFFFP